MPILLRQLPFFAEATSRSVPGGVVRILPYQIVLSVSIAPAEYGKLEADTPRFPAIFDTGFNGTFLLQEQHLHQWARFRRDELLPVTAMEVYGRRVPVYALNVWLYRNAPGQVNEAMHLLPFCLPLDPGLAVTPTSMGRPRLPLLGMRALSPARLRLSIDFQRNYVSLRTPQRI